MPPLISTDYLDKEYVKEMLLETSGSEEKKIQNNSHFSNPLLFLTYSKATSEPVLYSFDGNKFRRPVRFEFARERKIHSVFEAANLGVVSRKSKRRSANDLVVKYKYNVARVASKRNK